MLTVISPAKKLDFTPAKTVVDPSIPAFQADAISLANTARRLSAPKLRALMNISQDLARLNQSRFGTFKDDPDCDGAKPAALAFAGDTYVGLEAASLDGLEMAYAQTHLRILSGLYGLLRPMDLIQPYRLEMGSRLATRRGKTLYQYWRDRIAAALDEQAVETGASVLVNCASVEYFTAVAQAALSMPVVTPVFLDVKDSKARIVGFFAKRARGAMARFIIQNRIDKVDGLRDFETGGYQFQPDMSDKTNLVFLRDEPVRAT